MQTQNSLSAGSIGWLGFELSVLRRLKFGSVALPLAGEPGLGLYLKRWNARVAANDPAQWAWIKSQAFIENNCERLTEADLEIDRKSTRLNSSHSQISYAVFCLKKKKTYERHRRLV